MTGFKTASYCVIGNEHLKNNKVCQDSALSYTDDNCVVGIVADGHGGNDYFRSDIGSRIATEVSLRDVKKVVSWLYGENKNLEMFLSDEKVREDIILQLKKEIVSRWKDEIKKHHEQNPFTQDDFEKHTVSQKYITRFTADGIIDWAYGSTVIIAVVTKHFYLALQLGDGNCVELLKGETRFNEQMPGDPKCVGESSTSLCQADALDSFRHFYSSNIPIAVIVHSDGIDDSLLDDSTRFGVYADVMAAFKDGFDPGAEWVGEKIVKPIAMNWKRDDTSLAVIVNEYEMCETASQIYAERVKERELAVYNRAVADKAKLAQICQTLETSIAGQLERKEQLRQEYQAFSAKAETIKKEVLKIRELYEKNVEILEYQQTKLKECEDIIEQYESAHKIEIVDSEDGEEKEFAADMACEQAITEEQDTEKVLEEQMSFMEAIFAENEKPTAQPEEASSVEEDVING